MNSLELYDSYEPYYEGREPTEEGIPDGTQRGQQAQSERAFTRRLNPREVGDERVEHHHAGRGGAQA
jgi:hypothetical protein